MKQLSWTQKNNKVYINLPTDSGEVKFLLQEKLINHIVATTPPVIYINVKLNNSSTKEYIINFSGLRPVVSQESHLQITIGNYKSKPKSKQLQNQAGYYSIIRGESYRDRFLNEDGWQQSPTSVDLYLVDVTNEIKSETQKEEPKVILNLKQKEESPISSPTSEENIETPPKPKYQKIDDFSIKVSIK